MKIALIGYGKMGQMIEKVASDSGHCVVVKLTSQKWDFSLLEKADVCMEFTHPECVIHNVRKLATFKKNIVIGTTGWHDHLNEIHSIVNEHQIGVLYSSNFSKGIYLLLEILNSTSQLMNDFHEYDVAGIECHHNKKKDSPSGTALEIEKTMARNMKRSPPFSFTSIRCGSIPGTHTILFDSPHDTISIKHEARTREGFAQGALQAAEWLMGKKGLYTFSDCMQELIHKRPL